ncbi:MAG: AAA family ATPase [Acidobacteriaceae bacterium]|nr:AAA family ATPase [Acidobacteriaceae bacterium]
MVATRLLLHIQDADLRRETLQVLRDSGNPIPYQEHEGNWDDLCEQTSRIKPEVLVLDLTVLTSELNIAMRQLRTHAPRVKVIALHPTAEPKMILAAMRSGVNEFLHPPLADALVTALERLLNASEPEHIPTTRGRVIGFLSAKGGCGATTLACHVAWELQNQTRKKVLLADLDLTSGLVGFLMKTPSSYSILDAIKNLARLDESLWKALVSEYRPNLSVLPACPSYSRWDQPAENDLRQVIQFTRTQHDWVILDLGRSLNPIANSLLEEMDQLFLVSTLEVVALHGLKSIVHGLFDQGEKLQLILNRTPKMMDISTQELEKILGRSLYAALPNDYMSLYQSYSNGNLLNPDNRLAQHFALLASKIAGMPPAKSKKKFALFG